MQDLVWFDGDQDVSQGTGEQMSKACTVCAVTLAFLTNISGYWTTSILKLGQKEGYLSTTKAQNNVL
jgi:hypothetical protein